MDLTPQAPAVHFHGDEANLLSANDYKDQQDALDMATAKDYADALNTAYPGHLWAVNVQGEQGIATIHNLMLSGKYGYLLHLNKRYSASEARKKAVMAGGEILERFKVARGRMDEDKMALMPIDFAGNPIGELK